MLAFTENKKGAANNKDGNTNFKKRDEKKKEKDQSALGGWASDSTAGTAVAAWHDPSVDKLQVNIEDSSRLRKLKKLEAETHITGEQYA